MYEIISDMSEVDKFREQLLSLIENGYLFSSSPAYRNGIAYFYLAHNETGRKEKSSMQMSREEYEDLKNELKELIKEKYGTIYYRPPTDEDEEDEDEKEKKPRVAFTHRQTLAKLDKATATQIEHLAETQSWFLKLVYDAGMQTLFMVMQLAKIPPDEWYQKIIEFRDKPQEFADFIGQYLVALFEAKNDAMSMMSLRKDYYYAVAEAEALKIKLAKKEQVIRDLIERINVLTMMLNEEQKQKYMMWEVVRSMSRTEEESKPQIEIVNKEGD